MGIQHQVRSAFLVSIFSLVTTQGDFNLLERVSENYHNLASFEIAGHVTATIPGTEWRINIETVVVGVGLNSIPEHSSALKHKEVHRFSTIKITDKDGRSGEPPAGVGVRTPTHLGIITG